MGFFAGLFLGLGSALLLFVFGIIPVTIFWLVGLIIVGIAIGIVLGFVAPRKPAKQQPPTTEGATLSPA